MDRTGAGGRRRRTTGGRLRRTGAVLGALGLCAALPWVVPSVPAFVAEGVPTTLLHASTTTAPGIGAPDGLAAPVGAPGDAGSSAGVRSPNAGRPLEVRVARLNVRSTVVPISGRSGTLEPPADPQQLGWWAEGREVGASVGSAVIVGHTVHTGGGAFDHLGRLVAGDRVRVRTAAGWIAYRVQRAVSYPTAQLARSSAEIFRLDGPGRLVLITCAGWNGTRFTANAVVYAVPAVDDPDQR